MTISLGDLALYAGALFVLFLTPGPVWLALTARAMSGGFRAAWPLALGVVVGDALWPLLAVLGVSWLASSFASAMAIMKWLAAAVFIAMGYMVIRNAGKTIGTDSRLTRPGMWAGFAAGVAVILGNPKAILFYMGMLPGFFDLSAVSRIDILLIVLASIIVPFIGNLIFAYFIDRLRRLVTSPGALRQMNILSGSLLILVGSVIPFT